MHIGRRWLLMVCCNAGQWEYISFLQEMSVYWCTHNNALAVAPGVADWIALQSSPEQFNCLDDQYSDLWLLWFKITLPSFDLLCQKTCSIVRLTGELHISRRYAPISIPISHIHQIMDSFSANWFNLILFTAYFSSLVQMSN